MPSTILNSDFSAKDWINYYLDIPVVLIERNDDLLIPNKGFTFRQWTKEGFENIFPNIQDFDTHIKTTWADVRLRPGYLEMRAADSVPFKYAMSLPALFKGLILSSASWEAVAELMEDWTYEDVLEVDKLAWEQGLELDFKGKSLLAYAQELITLSNEGLHHLNNQDSTGNDETVYLAPLKEQIYIKEQSFAQELISLYENEWNQDVSRILEWCEQE